MHCPNRACADFRLTGEHQEFTSGVTNCSTCGAALVEGPVLEAPAESETRESFGLKNENWSETMQFVGEAVDETCYVVFGLHPTPPRPGAE